MRLTKIDIAGLIVVGVLLIIQDARSQEMVMHFGSKHFGGPANNTIEYNEHNLGIGFAYPLARNFAVRGGIYDNSYNNNSVYFGGDVRGSGRLVRLGLQAGLATGYEGTPQGAGSVTPYLLPYVSVGTRTVAAEVGCVPPLFGKVGFMTFSLKVRL